MKADDYYGYSRAIDQWRKQELEWTREGFRDVVPPPPQFDVPIGPITEDRLRFELAKRLQDHNFRMAEEWQRFHRNLINDAQLAEQEEAKHRRKMESDAAQRSHEFDKLMMEQSHELAKKRQHQQYQLAEYQRLAVLGTILAITVMVVALLI